MYPLKLNLLLDMVVASVWLQWLQICIMNTYQWMYVKVSGLCCQLVHYHSTVNATMTRHQAKADTYAFIAHSSEPVHGMANTSIQYLRPRSSASKIFSQSKLHHAEPDVRRGKGTVVKNWSTANPIYIVYCVLYILDRHISNECSATSCSESSLKFKYICPHFVTNSILSGAKQFHTDQQSCRIVRGSAGL